ncbi:MAG TPA: hypothetical protein VF449_08030 [Parvibaculum sp.]
MSTGKAVAAPAPAESANGWYLSADSAWQNVNLPEYALGFHKVVSPSFNDAGPFQSLRQHLDGYRIQGVAGYFLPGEYSTTLIGANTRVEFGLLYGHATGSASGTSLYTDGGIVGLTMDGAGAGSGYICAGFQPCTTTTNLSSTYSNWQIDGKIAGEERMGEILVTRSLAVFGGDTHTGQAMVQSVQIGAAPTNPTYKANTSVRWADIGVRAGLGMKVDLTSRVTADLGGSVGLAGRHATLEGSDFAGLSTLTLLDGASSVSDSGNTMPVVANAEAGLSVKILPALTLRGFTGFNFDSKVPGVTSPSFGGTVGVVTSRSPARTSFQSEFSYYAGAGMSWTF